MTRRDIMARLGLTASQLSSVHLLALDRLAKRGLIEVQQRRGPHYGHDIYVYRAVRSVPSYENH